MDPAIFYPEDPEKWEQAAFVKELCANCPVRMECIDYSVTSPYTEEGYWGMDPTDRIHLRQLYRSSVAGVEDVLWGVAEALVAADEPIV